MLAGGFPLRVLVVDDSRVLPWQVQRLSGPAVDVRAVDSFEEALGAVLDESIDAAVVSVSPARLPWNRFQSACARCQPPVPVLYESCLFTTAEELGISPVEGWASFLSKPATRLELEEALRALLAEAERARVLAC